MNQLDAPPPGDLDLAVLLRRAAAVGVRVWRADRTGALVPITNPNQKETQ